MPPPLILTNDDQDLVLTVEDSGDEPRLIRSAGLGEGYAWPAWSPDGERLLVSRGRRGPDGAPELDLLLVDPTHPNGDPSLFSNDDEHREPIAPGAIHYAYWAPGGNRALVAARGEDGLGLSLVTPDDSAATRTVISGAPMFTAWSPDGRTLAAHAGPQLVLIDPATEAEPRQILRDQPRFRAPAWSPDGSRLYYAAPGAEGKDLLWRSPPQDGEREVVAETDGLTALLASPTADAIALLTLDGGGLGGHDLRLLDPNAGDERLIDRGQVLGAFWSPDGSALFWVSRPGSDANFALSRYDIAAGRPHGLARFRPSPAFSTYLAFFDQYAHSHRLVSADGRWVVVGGTMEGNGGNLGRPFAPQFGCYVLPTDGSGPPRRVAAGEIGFFSPALGTTD